MNLVELQKRAHSPKEEGEESPKLTKNVGKEKEVEAIKFAKRTESFQLKYTVDSGEEKVAQLHSKVMDYAGRQRYDRVLADLSGGLNFDNLPTESKTRYICIARAICQLIDPPEWVLNAIGEDVELCYSIGGKLFDHETRFFRYNTGESSLEESKSRFQIT